MQCNSAMALALMALLGFLSGVIVTVAVAVIMAAVNAKRRAALADMEGRAAKGPRERMRQVRYGQAMPPQAPAPTSGAGLEREQKPRG
jgi:hypothetical protein